MKETFGQRFTRLRKEKGLTQEDIALKVNISTQAVSKWENDISMPDIGILGDLADILAISIDELLGKTKPTVSLSTNENKDINKMALKIKILMIIIKNLFDVINFKIKKNCRLTRIRKARCFGCRA